MRSLARGIRRAGVMKCGGSRPGLCCVGCVGKKSYSRKLLAGEMRSVGLLFGALVFADSGSLRQYADSGSGVLFISSSQLKFRT